MKRGISYRGEKSAAADDKHRLRFLQPPKPREGKKGRGEAAGELLERGPLSAQRLSAPAAPRWASSTEEGRGWEP